MSKFNLVIVDSVILNNNSDGIMPVFETLSQRYNVFVLTQKTNKDRVVETLAKNNVLIFCSVEEEIKTSRETMNIGWVDNSEASESKLTNFCKVVLFSSKAQRKKLDRNIGVAQDWEDVLNYFVRKDFKSHIS